MSAQPPVKPPRGAPYEDTLSKGLKYLEGHPVLVFGVLLLLLVVILSLFVPTALDRPLPYVLLGVGLLLVVVDSVLLPWLRAQMETPSPPVRLPKPAPPIPETPPSAALRQRYLESLIAECCRSRLVGLDPQAADPAHGNLSLEHLYVELDTLTPAGMKSERRGKARDHRILGDWLPMLTAVEALAQAPRGRMVLLGLPGAGKSTFVRYLALRMAQVMRDPTLSLDMLLPGWDDDPLLPLIVPLGRLAESLPTDAPRGNAGMVERFVCQTLDADKQLHGWGDLLLAEIRRDGGLVLFDGLDEVANLDLRPRVREAVEDFAQRYAAQGKTHCLVTCRTYSYTDPRWQLTGWPAHQLAPLSQEKIFYFVRAWHDELVRVDPGRQEDYRRKCDKMLRALDPSDRRRLAEIAPNPLILTVMAVVHTHKGELPDARALVYEECVDLLLVRWEMERSVTGQRAQKRSLLDALAVPRITLENALQEIAYKAHEGSGGTRQTDAPAALVTEDLLAGSLLPAFGDENKVRTFLDYCESANGLLMLQGVAPLPGAPPDAPLRRVFAFPHMTFEEYLAGRYIGRMANQGQQVREHVDRSDRWREPVMLLGEHLCFRTGDFERVNAILEHLVPDPPPCQPRAEDWRAVWLAGDLLMLYRRALQRKPPLDERVVQRLCALLDAGALPAPERAAAGRALAALDDPRPGVGVRDGLPDILWCYVPSGPFTMGSQDDPLAYDDETPQHPRDLPYPYWIARYPITNAQFDCFVQDPKGYAKDHWWTPAGRKWRGERRGPDKAGGVYDLPNHPAVMITWYEAVAYCRWLTERLRGSGFRFQVPSEAEWEKAARGGHLIPRQPILHEFLPCEPPADLHLQENPRPARIYPWGDDPDPDCANYDETGIGSTCAVGIFPRGRSPYGCLDMAGNVWEWCGTRWLDNYAHYDDNAMVREDVDGEFRRVVRGGSFFDDRLNVRCAVRLRYAPDLLGWNLGFRPVAHFRL
jgi:formylglycine-generating enzyme required for sulfatase activity